VLLRDLSIDQKENLFLKGAGPGGENRSAREKEDDEEAPPMRWNKGLWRRRPARKKPINGKPTASTEARDGRGHHLVGKKGLANQKRAKPPQTAPWPIEVYDTSAPRMKKGLEQRKRKKTPPKRGSSCHTQPSKKLEIA